MSTDFNCVDDKNKVWWHLGQRMAGSYSFGYGENDKNGIFHAAEFICDRLAYGQSLRIVLTDDIPEDYEEIDIAIENEC